ncbi:MAG: hypothetical protein AAGI38_07015 [Bacteroidota bacterium]
MRLIGKTLKLLLVFAFLTLVSQTGGILYLLWKPVATLMARKGKGIATNKWFRRSCFILLFAGVNLFVLPFLAEPFDRKALPIFASEAFPIKAGNVVYPIFNRHYVTPELYQTIQKVAVDLRAVNPDFTLVYLDANFPFIEDFPLLPHRSHNDGEKLDLCFVYQDEQEKPSFVCPGFLGYGHSEVPTSAEYDQPAVCTQKGYWQYSIMYTYFPEISTLKMASTHTKALIKALANHPKVRKIFLEPHLKSRLGLSSYSKVRFHGCKAVRHDDHIHVEL